MYLVCVRVPIMRRQWPSRASGDTAGWVRLRRLRAVALCNRPDYGVYVIFDLNLSRAYLAERLDMGTMAA